MVLAHRYREDRRQDLPRPYCKTFAESYAKLAHRYRPGCRRRYGHPLRPVEAISPAQVPGYLPGPAGIAPESTILTVASCEKCKKRDLMNVIRAEGPRKMQESGGRCIVCVWYVLATRPSVMR